MQLEKYKKREENRVGKSTLSSRMSALRRLEEFVDGDEITVDDVENWVDSLIEEYNRGEIKSSTIRQYVKAADYYFETVHGEYDQLDHIKRRIPDIETDHGEYLTEEEWNMLRHNVLKFRDRAFIEIMYWYSRRPSEVRLLNEEDIDMEEDTITFHILKKERDDRGQLLPMLELVRDGEVYEEHRVFRATFELIPEVKSHIESHMKYKGDMKEKIVMDGEEKEVHPLFSGNNSRISYSTVWEMVKNEARRAGIDKNITPKSWRHSRITHLNWQGATPQEIADRIALHDPDSDVIGGYVHPRDEEDVREVMGTGDEE